MARSFELQRFAVLGASGFIGGTIAKKLGRSSRNPLAGVSSDRIDLANMESAAALASLIRNAIVVHAAAIPRLRDDSFEAMQSNLAICDTLLRACELGHPERIVFFSSVEVYGAPRNLPVNELSELAPLTNYGVGKIAAEQMLRRWCNTNSVPLCIFRLPGVYGPCDGGRGLIGALANCVRNNVPFRLTTRGATLRDYCFVGDVARAVEEIVPQVTDTETLNLVSGNSLSITEIIEIVQRHLGKCMIECAKNFEEAFDLRFDNSRLVVQAPGFRFTDLPTGITSYLQAMTVDE